MADLGKGSRKAIASTMEDQAKAMKFNPLVASDSANGVLGFYPLLGKVEAVKIFNGTGSVADRKFKNRAIKFMIWLYSKDSILNTKPAEPLIDRKLKAAHLAGFQMNRKTNQFDERVVTELFQLGDIEFVRAVLSFLRFQKQELWSEIIVSEEQHYEAMRLRLTPVTGTNKTTMEAADLKKKLRLECKELMMDIKSYWEEFWEDNYDLKALGQEMLYQSIEDRARINVGQ